MLEAFYDEGFIKLAVDIRRRVLAGGGAMHADCEAVLIDEGSQQADVWGADWLPQTHEVRFESVINLRPRQGNFRIELTDPELRRYVEAITRELMEGAE
ncbi:MAG: hypothetical protein HY023_08405 [Chloroflexi bacterium]|nr:hypothetical protein [Chloroflexota bacterium]MBI3763148.1 hypothetical protein [Chloroflexota bacterium]